VISQVLLCAGAVFVYFRVRGLTDSRPDVAFHNANLVQRVERDLRIDWERTLQQQVIDHRAITEVLNWIYIYGHWPVIVITLVWLLIRHVDAFRRTRNARFASGAVGMAVFALFPVAPPRLAHLGLVDTVTEQTNAYRVLQPTAFTNQYAAMPSLHVGWDLLIGLAIWTAGGRLWVRLLGLAMPVAMTLAVVLTANHYLLDVVVGVTLTTAAWILFQHTGSRGRRTGGRKDAGSKKPSSIVIAASATTDGRQPIPARPAPDAETVVVHRQAD